MSKTIAVLGTLDTKGEEVRSLQELIEARGHRALVMDIGIVNEAVLAANVSREEVAVAGGAALADLVAQCDRDRAMDTMGVGAGSLLRALFEAGQLDGAIGIGGAQGTYMVSRAMQELPVGVPKFIVSATASGNIRPWIRHKDIAIMFSVADLLGGPNTVTRTVLANAAAAIIGMVEAGLTKTPSGDRTMVAVTAFGTTNAAVVTAVGLLKGLGCEPIAFHASGACGSAMEELINQGLLGGVLDLTTHELVGELMPEDIYAPVKPGRLEAAARMGTPLVFAPGGLNHLVFGPVHTIPIGYRRRDVYVHNPTITTVKLTPGEMRQLALLVAERLNAARGPLCVLIPKRGWSALDKPGAPMHNPEGNRAFVDALKRLLGPHVAVAELPAHLNDPEFAREAVARIAGYLAIQAEKPEARSC
jgi:uncharacterized protein (UPF0261 family)